MTEEVQAKYFEKSGTYSPSMETYIWSPMATEETIDMAKEDTTPTPYDELVNQDIIKFDAYPKIRATRRVIGHVHFEPD
jgi:hypothetical protein